MPGTPMGTAPLDGKIVFDLVYAPADTALLQKRARRRLPDDRRHRDVDRAGRTPVRVMDRPAASVGAVRGSRRRAATRRPAVAERTRQEDAYEANHVRGVRRVGQARHVRAGGQGDHRRSADAGVRVSQDRRTLRLRVPLRERRRRGTGGAILLSRQGSLSRPARAKGRHHARAIGNDDRERRGVRGRHCVA